MSFTYDFTTAPQIAYVRLLIPDTNSARPIFSDDEVNAALYLESSQSLYVSGMAAQTAAVGPVPVQVYSYRRSAALLIDSIASSKARLATIQQLLDVKIDGGKAQAALHELAESLREQEENMGHFAIAEMVHDDFGARERMRNQLLRLAA